MAPDIQVSGQGKRVMIGAEYTNREPKERQLCVEIDQLHSYVNIVSGHVLSQSLDVGALTEGAVIVQCNHYSPGPARYYLPTTVGNSQNDVTKKGSPSYSFGSRQFRFKPEGPGPAYLLDSDITNKGRSGQPSFSIYGRAREPSRDTGPGPGAYNVDRKPLREKNAPIYSMSPRTSQRRVDFTPSPNTYSLPPLIGPNVPHQRGGPATRMAGRIQHLNFSDDLAKTPGPAGYAVVDHGLVKKRMPAYSLLGRPRAFLDKDGFPGPGSYNPEKVNIHIESSPKYAIGAKHSQYTMPVMPLADVTD